MNRNIDVISSVLQPRLRTDLAVRHWSLFGHTEMKQTKSGENSVLYFCMSCCPSFANETVLKKLPRQL